MLYTDGSMIRGNTPEVADVACAIVADEWYINKARTWAGQRWINGDKPNTLKVLHMGKVQGSQTVNWAELWAICKAYSKIQDSTYAIGTASCRI